MKGALAQVKTAIVMAIGDNDWQRDLAGAFEWWREAGIDLSFTDVATAWIAPPEDTGNAQPALADDRAAALEPAPRIGGDPSGWPQDPASFMQWWLSEASLDPGPLADRVPPRGVAEAELMMVVEHPERGDREHLLSGPEGTLLDAFIKVAGIRAETTYVASALPRCTPLPDWASLKRDGLGAILAHHIALVRPKRVILFGPGVSSLLDHDPAQTGQNLPNFNHDSHSVPKLVVPAVGSMVTRPARKAALWGRWLDWTGRQ